MINVLLKLLLRLVLHVHNGCYRVASRLAVHLEGLHPKHRLMRYKEWFLGNLGEDDVVLDIGCNTGSMPRVLAKKAEYVYGIELVKHHLDYAEKNNSAPNISYIHADATAFDYSQIRPVSVVTMSNVLEHIEDRVGFLTKLTRGLHWRDGIEKLVILIRVPMIDRDWITLFKKELGIEWRLDRTHYTEYTRDQFDEEMKAAGIAIKHVEIRFGELYAQCELEKSTTVA